MTKATMPEPVAWMTKDGRTATKETKDSAMATPSKLAFSVALITTTQAEAYANARVREAQRWQPMETAPAEGRPVLLFAGLYRDGHEYAPTIVVGWHLDKEGWIASGYSGSPIAHLKPKAWMPLPAFPSTPAQLAAKQ